MPKILKIGTPVSVLYESSSISSTVFLELHSIPHLLPTLPRSTESEISRPLIRTSCQRHVRAYKPRSAYTSPGNSYGVFTSGWAVGHRYSLRGFGVARQGVHLAGPHKVTASRVSTTELRVSPHKPSLQKYRVTAVLGLLRLPFFLLPVLCAL